MDSFFKRLKKSSDFEIDPPLGEQIKKIDCLQISQTRLREDIRRIVREELMNILNELNKSLVANRVNEKKSDPNKIYFEHQIQTICLNMDMT